MNLSSERKSKKNRCNYYQNFEGKLPDNLEDLLTLLNWKLHANAILAIIAFNKSYIPLDGNIESLKDIFI